MAYISYNKLWESEFDGIVSKRDKLQDANYVNADKVLEDFLFTTRRREDLEKINDTNIQ